MVNFQAKKRLSLLALSLLLLLSSYHGTSFASVVLNEDTPDYVGVNVSGGTFVISEDEAVSTYSTATQNGGGSYSSLATLELKSGSTWRPMDSLNTMTAGGGFIMNDGATVDLAYKYSAANGYYEGSSVLTRPYWEITSAAAAGNVGRRLTIGTSGNGGKFGDNLTFVLNMGTRSSAKTGPTSYEPMVGGYTDQILLNSPTLLGETSNINVKFTLTKNFFAKTNTSWSWLAVTDPLYEGKVDEVFRISNSDTATLDKFNVTGEMVDVQIDGAFTKYIFNAELLRDPLSATLEQTARKWSIFWTASKGDALSQSAYSASNAVLATRNLWRIEDGLFFARGEDLRFRHRGNGFAELERHDGLWTNVWGGEYTFGGIQGSKFNQTYHGLQVGYDKLRGRLYAGGRLYYGAYASKMDSTADFYAQTAGGGDYNSSVADLESLSVGAYALWHGQKGRYIEGQLRWSRLANDYAFTDSFGETYEAGFSNRVYSTAFRYGRRVEAKNGIFFEPQVGITYGKFESYDYTMGDSLRYTQPKSEGLIGRFALSLGKDFGSDSLGNSRGQVYLKAAANHDFLGDGTAMMHAENNNGGVIASQSVNVLAAEDTWYDLTLGANLKLNPRTSAWLALNKSFGGDVNTKWQVNGGLSWSFGGPKGSALTTASVNDIPLSQGNASLSPMGFAAAPIDNRFYSFDSAPISPVADGLNEPSENEANHSPGDDSTTTNTSIDRTTTVGTDGDGIYTLPTLTVEADRPTWERNLSPGTISVVDVPKYDGEHKTFADMLQTVPGVYIDRVSGGGTGHYTTARIRGSSASQVNIYMDGVLVNTGSEQAVNLENINMDNVERIEVYRGYIPARFAGAAMGGAINVVTKRPDKVGGKVTAGLRSFGGQKLGLETTAPLGRGSLMLAYNYDKADGDFKYTRLQQEVKTWKLDGFGGQIPDEVYPNNRKRQNNGYENHNLFAKWQDDNWFVKLDYLNNSTERPATASRSYADLTSEWLPAILDSEWVRAMRNSTVDTEKLDFSLGRRQTHKNLDWGWKVAAMRQEKTTLYTRAITAGQRHTGTNIFKNTALEATLDGSWRPSDRHLIDFMFTARKETMKVGFEQHDQWSSAHAQDFGRFFVPKYNMRDYYFQVQDTIKLDDSGSFTYTPLARAQKSEIGAPVDNAESWLYSYSHGLKKSYSNWTLRGTYGSYYKTPSWYEVFGDGANVQNRWFYHRYNSTWSPELYAEYGKSWDISANWTGKVAKTDADITLTYFNRHSENLLATQFDPMYGAVWYINYGKGKINGIELDAKFQWRRFDLSLGVTWQDSLITKGHTRDMTNTSNASGIEGQPFPLTPEHQFNVRLDYRFPKDKLSVFGEYHYISDNNWYSGSGNRSYYTELGMFNVGMKYRFNPKFNMNLGINDIANEGPKQRHYSAGMNDKYNAPYPQQGRTYYFTLEHSF